MPPYTAGVCMQEKEMESLNFFRAWLKFLPGREEKRKKHDAHRQKDKKKGEER